MRYLLFCLALLSAFVATAQKIEGEVMDYSYPREYTIGGITVSGCVSRDPNAVKMFSGLQVGDKLQVPGDRFARAIKSIWEQKLFTDVRIEVAETRSNVVFLHIIVQENPELRGLGFGGTVSKSASEKIRDDIGLIRGQQVNEANIANAQAAIRRYFVDKGYLKATSTVVQTLDSTGTGIRLIFKVDRGPKVKVQDIFFHGNEHIADARLRRALKETKRKRWWNVFGSSKYKSSDFRDDKRKLIDLYNEKGYRNAVVLRDSLSYVRPDRIRLDIYVDEDQQFYFRDVIFTGNTKYSADTLSRVLGIKRGDVYNKKRLDSRLFMNPSGVDVSSLYMDRGYLSFYPEAIERVEGDSIDLEIRLREGKQYRVREVNILGNSKTFDHVVRREIRTRPGDLFDRSEVIRSQQQLISLGFFDPQAVNVTPKPDPRTGFVDLDYIVGEKPSDRLELSGGYGMNRVLLSLGLSFTNFSMRKVFDGKAWSPLPSGDGQTLSLRAQTNGAFFQSYSLSFVEPWLGGRKPNSLSVSTYFTKQSTGVARTSENYQSLGIFGAAVGLGRRLRWPDDYFFINYTLGYQQYQLNNWRSGGMALFSFSDGRSNVITGQVRVSRRSIAEPFWITQGSEVAFSVKATPPYSAFSPNTDYRLMADVDRYRFVEFHKWKFTSQWFTRLTRSKSKHDLVLMARVGFGFIGQYNARKGQSPFERFYLGGNGLTGFNLDGREILAMRGYDDLSLSPDIGAFFVNKYTMELRFPVSLNPQATIFALGFVEAANTYTDIDRYDPFRLYRSAGIGLRLFLPMFGPMGLDYGWRFDDVPTQMDMAKGRINFTIGIDLGEL